jgi:hypothetical protein
MFCIFGAFIPVITSEKKVSKLRPIAELRAFDHHHTHSCTKLYILHISLALKTTMKVHLKPATNIYP